MRCAPCVCVGLLSYGCVSVLALGTVHQPEVCDALTLQEGEINFLQTHLQLQQRVNYEADKKKISISQSGPTLHFLFLLMDSLPHAKQWKTFFAGASASKKYSMWAHCVEHEACKESVLKVFPDVQLVSTVYSERMYDLVTPMVQLVTMALKASINIEDKFVFVSDSTLPVKPFPDLFAALISSHTSDFCFHPEESETCHVPPVSPYFTNWPRTIINGTVLVLPKTHQWSVLRRDHAEALAQNWQPPCTWERPCLNPCNWTMPYGDDKISRTRFPCLSCNWATDEFAVLANILGPLNETMVQRESLDFNISPKCHTWTQFPEKGGKVLDKCSDDGPQFSMGHATNLENLTNSTILLLRSSPYLFARKFVPEDPLAYYEELMFGPLVASHDLPDCI